MEALVIAGRYRLERRLGGGGMSEVWAADDLELDRSVAVKLLAPDGDPARFEREARAAAALSHPNIAGLYDYGEDAGRRYMVLEYLPRGSLEERLHGDALPDTATQRIAREVAAGLAHAHERGLVHRDLKPSNILFDSESRAKIADFGIARLEQGAGMTEAGTVLGTASYISPEQAAGETATAASDVYAFGVILFRMLTGRLPFESPDALSLAAMHRDLPPPPVSAFREDAPPRLESLATACLAKSPGDRPPNGRALVDELGATAPAAAESETAALTQVLPAPAVTSHRRRKVLAVLAAGVALAAAGVALAVTLGSGGKGPSLQPATSSARHTTLSQPTTSSTMPTTTEEDNPVAATSSEAATTASSSTATTTTSPTTERQTTTEAASTATEPPAFTDTAPLTDTYTEPASTSYPTSTDTYPTSTSSTTTAPAGTDTLATTTTVATETTPAG